MSQSTEYIEQQLPAMEIKPELLENKEIEDFKRKVEEMLESCNANQKKYY